MCTYKYKGLIHVIFQGLHPKFIITFFPYIGHWHHGKNLCALGETLQENDLNEMGCLVLYQHQPQGYQANYFVRDMHQGRDSVWPVGGGLAESRIESRRTSESYNQVPVLG